MSGQNNVFFIILLWIYYWISKYVCISFTWILNTCSSGWLCSGHSELVTGLGFSNDCRHLISVSGDSCIFVWRLPSDMVHTMQVLYTTMYMSCHIETSIHLHLGNDWPEKTLLFNVLQNVFSAAFCKVLSICKAWSLIRIAFLPDPSFDSFLHNVD